MKLKEKFDNVEIMFENQIGSLKYDELQETSNHCKKIAEDFAIEFAEWLSDWHTKERLKQLLEIYKNEQNK